MMKKKYSIIAWDWRQEQPLDEIVSNSRLYKLYYQHFLDDTNFVIFSDARINIDEEAEMILANADAELDVL